MDCLLKRKVCAERLRLLVEPGLPVKKLWTPENLLAVANDGHMINYNVQTGKAHPFLNLRVDAWSPDGQRAAYVQDYALFLTATSGGTPVRMTGESTVVSSIVAWIIRP
jgi:hypothetical protein